MMLLAGCGAKQAEAQAAAEPAGEAVRAVGVCAMPGTQPGCLTVKAKGKLYDVSSSVDASKGVAVTVKGQANGASSACGATLTDVSVEYLEIQCAVSPPGESLAAPPKP
jgi:hypothetical protein